MDPITIATRAQLLMQLKAHGYNGPADLKQVKAWIRENSEIIGLDESDADLDTIWKSNPKIKAVTLDVMGGTLTVEEQAGAEGAAAVPPEEGEDPQEMRARSAMGRDAARFANAAASKTGKVHAAMVHTEGKGGRYGAARKMYDARVKSLGVGKGLRQARWTDGDTAEYAGAFLRVAAAKAARVEYPRMAEDLDIVGKGQFEHTNTLGGFLVPEEVETQLIWLTEQYGVARRVANVVAMGSDTKWQPRKTGIGSASHIAEGGTMTATNNTYDRVELVARKVYRLCTASSEVLEDAAVGVADDLADSFAEAFSSREDDDYINGDGTAAYGGHVGLKNSANVPSVSASGNAWSAIVHGDMLKALGSLENVNPARIGIICSRQFYYQVLVGIAKNKSGATPADAFGTGGMSLNFMDAMWDGLPVVFSQKCATASGSAVKSAYIGDFVGGSMFGNRRGVTVATSEHYAFNTDEIAWRATERFTVNIHGDGKGSTFGPMVTLITT